MFRSILVGTDGSPTAARAVDKAVDLAADCGASLTIASVGEPDVATRVVQEESARVGDRVDDLRTKALTGTAADALVAEAQNGYDLLVVGNKGMKGLSRFVTGSVPNRVSHHAPVALLIVRTT